MFCSSIQLSRLINGDKCNWTILKTFFKINKMWSWKKPERQLYAAIGSLEARLEGWKTWPCDNVPLQDPGNKELPWSPLVLVKLNLNPPLLSPCPFSHLCQLSHPPSISPFGVLLPPAHLCCSHMPLVLDPSPSFLALHWLSSSDRAFTWTVPTYINLLAWSWESSNQRFK